MTEYGFTLYAWTGWLAQFALAFGGFAAVLNMAFYRRSRWRISWQGWRRWTVPPWFLRLWRTDRESAALHERRVWLIGCGLRIQPGLYLACRRMVIFLSFSIAAFLWIFDMLGIWPLRSTWNAMLLSALPACAAWFDGAALNVVRRYRTDRIRRELIAISSQLLYYTGSRLHLHGKLMRCLPLTGIIRTEMGMLLNEWYHDPDGAIRKFKERLGTEEAYGFSECLRSLRLHESDDVYDLLRELVREYKAKIELAKQGRKETASYLLFVLAGVPILYTFQIFLYPWVQEASRLFDALNP